MRAVMVMYDSLDKHYLEPYGCPWTHTPNFTRLAQRSIKFNNFYVGSMPCMPARRELHTGRYNFLHCSWGPLEPFDDSMPEILKNNGVYTHLCTDHYHYWQDGGATYHNRYSSCEFSRGQEGDAWKGEVAQPDISNLHETEAGRAAFQWTSLRQDMINRKYITCDEQMPQSRTFRAGLEFLEANHSADQWFLTIETFDPHEPFFTQPEYKELYPHEYHGKQFDWPNYAAVRESDEDVNHVRQEYAALVSMCDAKLGLVLDAFDRYDLWKDTMLIVNTDHGFLLGEHDWWGKLAPLYNEVANTPLFLHDPRISADGTECDALCQTIDIASTILEYFGQKIPKDMMGKPLNRAYRDQEKLRGYALYGQHGSSLCITDGRYTYFRAPKEKAEFFEYTLMPTAMADRYAPKDFEKAEMAPAFAFTKRAKVMKIKRKSGNARIYAPFDLLYDLKIDPGQMHEIRDYERMASLCRQLTRLLKENDAPDELYRNYGLAQHGFQEVTPQELQRQELERTRFYEKGVYRRHNMTVGAKEYLHALLSLVPDPARAIVIAAFEKYNWGKAGTIGIPELNRFLAGLQNGPMAPLANGGKMLEGFFRFLDRQQPDSSAV